MKTNRTLVLFTALMLIIAFSTSVLAQDGAKAIAVTLSVKGTVELKQGDGEWGPLKFGAVLNDGDRIRTGKDSYTALVFTDDKSQLKIRPESDISLNANRNEDHSLAKKVNIEVGELFAEVKQLKGTLQVATPTAVASVKGTVFWVIVNPDGSTMQLTLEGIVQLISNLTGQSIEVVAGQPRNRV